MEDERTCSMCGCVLQDHEQTEIDDELLCDHCAEEHTVQCDHCGETIWANDSVCDDRTTLCSCCFDDHYRRCEGCGRILHDDDVLWHNDLPYCANCYDRLDTEIEEYGYKPEPIFYGDGNRFFGVELEIDGAGKDDDSAARIKRQTNIRCEHIYCKSDIRKLSTVSEIYRFFRKLQKNFAIINHGRLSITVHTEYSRTDMSSRIV